MAASSGRMYSNEQSLNGTLNLLVVYILRAFLKLQKNLLRAVFFSTIYTIVILERLLLLNVKKI